MPATRTRRRRLVPGSRGDRGAAAVEFALVVPLLLLLVCGMVDFARAYNSRIVLSDAAAEGARTLALGGTADQARAQIRAALLGSTVDPSAVTYPVALVPCAASGAATARTQVTLQVDFHPVTPLIGRLVPTIPLTASGGRACFV